MAQTPTEKELSNESDLPTKDDFKKFALNFDKNILEPLKEKAYYDQDNIFEVLKIQRQELIHSNMLAFLFDPKQSDFLKNFLRVLVETECIRDFDFFDILYGNIENVNIDREHYTNNGRPIDILLNFEIINANHDRQKVVVVIENKVDSWQHDDQLKAYKEYVDNEPKWEKYRNKYYIYLTPNDDDLVEDPDWKRINYGLIGSALDLTSIKNTDESIRSLFEDYKKTVRSEFMNEEETKKLAEKIYSNPQNRKVLEYIFNHIRPNWVEKVSNIVFDLIKKNNEFELITRTTANNHGCYVYTDKNRGNQTLIFRPKSWGDKYPFYHFTFFIKELYLVFYIDEKEHRYNDKENNIQGSYYLIHDNNERNKFIEILQKEIFNEDKIRTECKNLTDKMFEPNGIIQQWLNSLKNRGNNA